MRSCLKTKPLNMRQILCYTFLPTLSTLSQTTQPNQISRVQMTSQKPAQCFLYSGPLCTSKYLSTLKSNHYPTAWTHETTCGSPSQVTKMQRYERTKRCGKASTAVEVNELSGNETKRGPRELRSETINISIDSYLAMGFEELWVSAAASGLIWLGWRWSWLMAPSQAK